MVEMTKGTLSYFRVAFVCTVVGLGLAGIVGRFEGIGALQAIFVCTVLSVLEISLSFDNAVVNASVLGRMTPRWRHRFLTWGIVIAVFGMRLVFPLVIVSIIGHLGPLETLLLAATHPGRYAEIMTEAHIPVAAFGGSFLLMVSLRHFMTRHRYHWIAIIERPLAKLSKFRVAPIVIGSICIAAIAFIAGRDFAYAAAFGVLTFAMIDGLSALLSGGGQRGRMNRQRASLGLFIYLEVLDASFSFDGVIGAFAITTSLFLITIGLGIGAFYVRSLTILLVEKGTLKEFRYLEHGAFWAIFALAVIMFVSVFAEVPEIITGTIGALLIGASVWSSLRDSNRAAPKVENP
jgi:hypothetical protein